MKRAFTAAALSIGLLTGGAATASASPVTSNVHVASSVAGSATVGRANSRPAALNAPVAKAQAAFPERRRTTTRKKKSGIGKIFGALAFLFIGLPLLIIAAIIIFFVIRSNRKKREREMAQQMNNQQFNNGFNNQGPRY